MHVAPRNQLYLFNSTYFQLYLLGNIVQTQTTRTSSRGPNDYASGLLAPVVSSL